MTPKQISERLIAIQSAIVDAIECQPFLDCSMVIGQNGIVYIMLYRDNRGGDYTLTTIKSETIPGALKQAEEYVAAMPRKEDMRKMDFQNSLASVIDGGHEIGMPNEIMNPLRSSMEALKENLLTDLAND